MIPEKSLTVHTYRIKWVKTPEKDNEYQIFFGDISIAKIDNIGNEYFIYVLGEYHDRYAKSIKEAMKVAENLLKYRCRLIIAALEFEKTYKDGE